MLHERYMYCVCDLPVYVQALLMCVQALLMCVQDLLMSEVCVCVICRKFSLTVQNTVFVQVSLCIRFIGA